MTESLFTEADVIDRYTRAQAIEDGVLVDLSAVHGQLVKEAGFRWPIAMTATAYAETVQEVGQPLPEGQDVNGRLWDVLWLLKVAIRRLPQGDDRLHFAVQVWQGEKHRLVRLWSVCGPGDDAEPVITVMLEGED